MNLLARYNDLVACGKVRDDEKQRAVLPVLERVNDEIERRKKRWFRPYKSREVKGLYLHGPVGAGKTFLMDLFFENLNSKKKMRAHLHHFMQQIDGQLRRLQGKKNPLQKIASDIAKQIEVLCFDEFVVNDIATAMILVELLTHLFEQGVILVATSNTEPDALYEKGLQRVRFIPAIEMIKAHCRIVSFDYTTDYRLGRVSSDASYFYPHNDAVDSQLDKAFNALSMGAVSTEDLLIQGRLIPCIKRSHEVVWFRFDVLCSMPRSQLDYLEIAKTFSTVILSELPKLDSGSTVAALLLIHLIDVLYDEGVRLIISATVPIEEIYQAGEMSQSFRRTRSRLEEMRSQDYLRRWQNKSKKISS